MFQPCEPSEPFLSALNVITSNLIVGCGTLVSATREIRAILTSFTGGGLVVVRYIWLYLCAVCAVKECLRHWGWWLDLDA